MVINFPINYLAVLVASIASFIFGWLWYGPLFGKIWAKVNKVKMEKKPPASKLFYHYLTTLLLVFFFSLLFNKDLLSGILLAFIIWIGFFVSTRLGSMIWMKGSWKLFFVDVIYHIINLLLIVIVLSLF